MMAEDMMTEMNRNRTTSSLSRGLTADMDDIDDALSRQLRPRAAARRRARLAGSALIVLALCAGSLAVVLFREQLLKMAIWIKALPPEQGGAAYTVLVALWLVALLPTSLLEIAGGFMFGFWLAALCSTLGKCLGSFISFAIGRRYKDWVREKLLDEPKTLHRGEPGYVAGLELAMRLNPFSTCLALRLAYVPEAVQNYVPAVLDAHFVPFASATMLGSSGYAMLWAKLGSELEEERDILKGGWTPEKTTFVVVGVASLFAVLGLVHWNTKRIIRRFISMQATNAAHLDGANLPALPRDNRPEMFDSSLSLV